MKMSSLIFAQKIYIYFYKLFIDFVFLDSSVLVRNFYNTARWNLTITQNIIIYLKFNSIETLLFNASSNWDLSVN